ncbi:hypothetical protein D3C80_2231640 [compost metagenome]
MPLSWPETCWLYCPSRARARASASLPAVPYIIDVPARTMPQIDVANITPAPITSFVRIDQLETFIL